MELEYSVDLTGKDLCILELWLEDEAEIRTQHRGGGLSHRVLSGFDDDGPIVPIVKPQPFEKFYVRDLSSYEKLSGVQFVYIDMLPDLPSVWLQFYVKGFNCQAFDDNGVGLDVEDVDFSTLAPKSIAEDDLIELTSEPTRVELP